MAAFDENVIADMVYDLLAANVDVVTVVSDRIYANRVKRDEIPTFPLVLYAKYADFIPTRTLASGITTYKGSYMVTGRTQDDPRLARDLAKAIQEALSVTTPAGFVDIFPSRSVYDEEAEEGDGVVYIRAGAIYEIEVTA